MFWLLFMSTAGEHYRAGNLAGAIESATRAVKEAPSDTSLRWLLGELLLIDGQLDRADSQFDTILSLEPGAVGSILPVRHLLRAAIARRDYFAGGGLPTFLEEGPTPVMRLLLEAFVNLRAGDVERAGELAAEAERSRPAIPCRVGKQRHTDFRDLDDLLSGVFEVFSSSGKYYWIPMQRVELLEFSKPRRPLDILWRPVRIVVSDAFDAEVHMPVIYGTQQSADDASKLGRRTDWLGSAPGPVSGVGQRVYLVDGDSEQPMMELDRVTFGG